MLTFQIFMVFLVVPNLIAFSIYHRDKQKAMKNAWRTPENTLLLWGITGPFGAYPAMILFRHKTRKTRFLIVPVFLVIQAAVIVFIFFKSG